MKALGFNKTPLEYGAFPTDPYSHTPGHAGAQQPGMTGQVKEEIMSRFGELGIRLQQGQVKFQPVLLRTREFAQSSRVFTYLDVDNQWQHLTLPQNSLAFTWCQVPFVYVINDANSPGIEVAWSDGREQHFATMALPTSVTEPVFKRHNQVRCITVTLNSAMLMAS